MTFLFFGGLLGYYYNAMEVYSVLFFNVVGRVLLVLFWLKFFSHLGQGETTMICKFFFFGAVHFYLLSSALARHIYVYIYLPTYLL